MAGERAPVNAKMQHTTHDALNIELHCDITLRTCENFITLCECGYYNGMAFHRNIRNFMIQGGDLTGTGRGGESIWRKPFSGEQSLRLLLVQEEIKIIGVIVFVNPYSEPDEEEEKW
ncbi:hypothetical protein V6N11_076014 [Hibiscus sabdariffa]|uniref:Peptidyl-prolyl cis-trans isomerase n=1 Tax=Hibiscus sabdariffa TaxID=183260 RepID=A0ABR2Q507_9ROSI